MDFEYSNNEKFRELCYIGDVQLIQSYYNKNKPDVNSKNKVNGWTCLHWASSKNNLNLVKYLLEIGSDKTIVNNDQKTPGFYAKDPEIRTLLNEEFVEPIAEDKKPTIVPNFVKNPQFHYADKSFYNLTSQIKLIEEERNKVLLNETRNDSTIKQDLITIRIRSNFDEDFVEFDLDKFNTDYDQFKQLCRKELDNVEKNWTDLYIAKIRKLPNVLIRNTSDIRRLKNEQEIEIVFA